MWFHDILGLSAAVSACLLNYVWYKLLWNIYKYLKQTQNNTSMYLSTCFCATDLFFIHHWITKSVSENFCSYFFCLLAVKQIWKQKQLKIRQQTRQLPQSPSTLHSVAADLSHLHRQLSYWEMTAVTCNWFI